MILWLYPLFHLAKALYISDGSFPHTAQTRESTETVVYIIPILTYLRMEVLSVLHRLDFSLKGQVYKFWVTDPAVRLQIQAKWYCWWVVPLNIFGWCISYAPVLWITKSWHIKSLIRNYSFFQIESSGIPLKRCVPLGRRAIVISTLHHSYSPGCIPLIVYSGPCTLTRSGRIISNIWKHFKR